MGRALVAVEFWGSGQSTVRRDRKCGHFREIREGSQL